MLAMTELVRAEPFETDLQSFWAQACLDTCRQAKLSAGRQRQLFELFSRRALSPVLPAMLLLEGLPARISPRSWSMIWASGQASDDFASASLAAPGWVAPEHVIVLNISRFNLKDGNCRRDLVEAGAVIANMFCELSGTQHNAAGGRGRISINVVGAILAIEAAINRGQSDEDAARSVFGPISEGFASEGGRHPRLDLGPLVPIALIHLAGQTLLDEFSVDSPDWPLKLRALRAARPFVGTISVTLESEKPVKSLTCGDVDRIVPPHPERLQFRQSELPSSSGDPTFNAPAPSISIEERL